MRKAEAIASIDAATQGRDVIVCGGVGSHQQILCREFSWDYPRRRLLTSSGLGCMGTALPYAIGAQLECPDVLVVVITGDGCFNMESPNLATVMEYALPIKIVILDDSSAGIVRQHEDLKGYSHVATANRPNPDFAAIARAYGIMAYTVASSGALESRFRQHMNEPKSVLFHVPVEDFGVWPILEGGRIQMTEEP